LISPSAATGDDSLSGGRIDDAEVDGGARLNDVAADAEGADGALGVVDLELVHAANDDVLHAQNLADFGCTRRVHGARRGEALFLEHQVQLVAFHDAEDG
jgi:hypothetical protein